jgi:hypothetical protein
VSAWFSSFEHILKICEQKLYLLHDNPSGPLVPRSVRLEVDNIKTHLHCEQLKQRLREALGCGGPISAAGGFDPTSLNTSTLTAALAAASNFALSAPIDVVNNNLRPLQLHALALLEVREAVFDEDWVAVEKCLESPVATVTKAAANGEDAMAQLLHAQHRGKLQLVGSFTLSKGDVDALLTILKTTPSLITEWKAVRKQASQQKFIPLFTSAIMTGGQVGDLASSSCCDMSVTPLEEALAKLGQGWMVSCPNVTVHCLVVAAQFLLRLRKYCLSGEWEAVVGTIARVQERCPDWAPLNAAIQMAQRHESDSELRLLLQYGLASVAVPEVEQMREKGHYIVIANALSRPPTATILVGGTQSVSDAVTLNPLYLVAEAAGKAGCSSVALGELISTARVLARVRTGVIDGHWDELREASHIFVSLYLQRTLIGHNNSFHGSRP